MEMVEGQETGRFLGRELYTEIHPGGDETEPDSGIGAHQWGHGVEGVTSWALKKSSD